MLKFSFFRLRLAQLSSSTLATLSTSVSGVSKILFLLIITFSLASCGSGESTSQPGSGGGASGEPGDEVLRIGNGSGDSFVGGALSANQTTLDAGESATILVNIVNQVGEPPSGDATVSFSSVCVSGALASFSAPISITPGLISVIYTAQGCAGDDIVTATLSETGATATTTLAVSPPQVLTVSFISSSVPQLSLAGIGGNESAELTFLVAGPQGVPIIGGNVTFSINTTVGGASILAGRETAISDNNGWVRTIINSGTVAGPVSVLAIHDATGIQGLSNDIVISSGIPVSSRFSLSYTDFNPANAFDSDGIEVTVSIIASDQFGNNPPDGTRISFVAPEAGNIENSCELVAGSCQVVWRSTNPRPADLRVEVIAYTDGAEDFIDNNGNSVFDGSDGAIIDLSEPYADHNENGVYDIGEFFFDTNNNEVRNTGNGLWDGPCLEQADPSAICTGASSTTIWQTATIVMSTNTPRLLSAGTFPVLGNAIMVAQGASTGLDGLIIADNNTAADSLGSNPLPAGTSVTFAVEGEGVTLQGLITDTIVNTTSPTGPYQVLIAAEEVTPPDPVSTTAKLTLTLVTPDNTTTQYIWPITITP